MAYPRDYRANKCPEGVNKADYCCFCKQSDEDDEGYYVPCPNTPNRIHCQHYDERN